MSCPSVVVLDYGSSDARATADALESAGAVVTITKERSAAMTADGMVVSGDGGFSETIRRLNAVRGAELIERRLAGGLPVLGFGAGMHILFERGHADATEGLGEWPGELRAHDHGGWGTVDAAPASILFAGLEGERFYFDHDAAATDWTLDVMPPFAKALLSWSDHEGRFLAAVENGPLAATQFHPQKSGEAGLRLLRNWLAALSTGPR